MKTILALAAAAAVALAVTVMPAAAGAATSSTHLCERSGPYCVGAPSLSDDQPVQETAAGRAVVLVPQGTMFLHDPVYLIEFASDTGKCVGVTANSDLAEVRGCSTDQTRLWFKVGVSNGCEWGSEEYSGGGIPNVLAGTGDDGAQMTIQLTLQPGFLERFNCS